MFAKLRGGLFFIMMTTHLASAGSDSTAVAARLYGALAKESGNLFFSPTSIRLALAMAYAGARGETAREIEKVFAFSAKTPDEVARLLASFDALANPKVPDGVSSSLENQKFWEDELARRRIVLKVANRIWGEKSYAFLPDYLKLLADRFRAPLGPLDFKHAPEPSRTEINKWVKEQTQGKIPQLLPENSVNTATRLILTNAIYFKATWREDFKKEATKDEVFYADSKEVRTPLMKQTDHFPIAEFSDGSLLEMAYGTGEMAMDVVLPKKRDGLAEIEKQFAAGALPKWLAALRPRKVDVSFPRFKVASSLGLAETLAALGMKTAFTFPGADFSGMDGKKELFISNVIHQAIVDVDEKGTEAAAATAVMMLGGGMPRPEEPVLFRADHPFLFLIRDTRSGEILFVGRLKNPKP